MNGLTVGDTYIFGTFDLSREYDFPPQFCLAYPSLIGCGFGPGNAFCAIQQYRQRQPDGTEVTTSFPGDYWDSPHQIAVDNCTSVTFLTSINGGGYVVADHVLTFW